MTETNETLKPCPFCGSDSVWLCQGLGQRAAECQNCQASVGGVDDFMATRKWNSRSETAAREAAEARVTAIAPLLRMLRRWVASTSGGVGYGRELMDAIDAALSAGRAQTGGEGGNV